MEVSGDTCKKDAAGAAACRKRTATKKPSAARHVRKIAAHEQASPAAHFAGGYVPGSSSSTRRRVAVPKPRVPTHEASFFQRSRIGHRAHVGTIRCRTDLTNGLVLKPPRPPRLAPSVSPPRMRQPRGFALQCVGYGPQEQLATARDKELPRREREERCPIGPALLSSASSKQLARCRIDAVVNAGALQALPCAVNGMDRSRSLRPRLKTRARGAAAA